MMFSLLNDDHYDDLDSIVPALLLQRSLANRRSAPNHIHRQHLGGQLHHEPPRHRVPHGVLSQLLNEMSKQAESERAMELADEKNKFKIMLDVQQFAPNEITVKVVDDFVVIEGNHEDKEDEHGWISRKFTRRYQIPKEWDIDQLSSKLSSDGVLTILAPPKNKINATGERMIPVHHTRKPAVQEKPQEKKEQNTESK